MQQPLLEVATRPVPASVHQKMVTDYWNHGTGWCCEEFRDLLPESTLNQITSIQVYPEAGIQDEIFWGKTSSGLFLIQTAIAMLWGDNSSDDRLIWKKIWKVEVPQKMRLLMWLVPQGVLMTNTNRVRRGMASKPECNMCPGLLEDTSHIFRTCERVREVWHYFEQANTGVHDPNLELKEWVLCNLTHMTNDTTWPMKFTVALWWLWRWRNEACLGRISNIPGSLKLSTPVDIAIESDTKVPRKEGETKIE
ncbi:hypothetical protein Cgig2_012685 [Carnegiea gigantea]|uniref:Reverse transcriptase zinc-binding domain-containing protein n=1 Tax=Carnegiea gigantea TaxID=171969 RepID=A0A9Q1Q9J2_9CARY|nr:hypothetical protein Cgig2_012685 [Carnegiea gigantea]